MSAQRSGFYGLLDNLIGYDDGVTTPGERLGRNLNNLGQGLLSDPIGLAGGLLGGVKADLDNLMFQGGAMQRPEDVLGYAAGMAAPAALAKAPAGALRSGPARPFAELDLNNWRDDYDFLGLRTVESGHDPLRPSRIWDNGDPTGEVLDGVSVTDMNSPSAQKMHGLAPRKPRDEHYYGDDTYLIGGNSASMGEDVGELVVRDPVVLMRLVRQYGVAGAAAMLGISAAEVEAAVAQ